MIGLIFLAAFALYCLASWFVVKTAISFARKNGKKTALWGWGAGLIMYLILFWDHLPTIALHQLGCVTSSGYWENKSIDQWKSENPGVLETLSRAHLPHNVIPDQWLGDDRLYSHRGYLLEDGGVVRPHFDVRNFLMWVDYESADGTKGVQMNERFRYFRKREGPLLFNRWRTEYTIHDVKTNEILARNVDFETRTEHPFHMGGGNYWKVWLNSDGGCPRHYFNNGSIHKYMESLSLECAGATWNNEPRYGDGFGIRCKG